MARRNEGGMAAIEWGRPTIDGEACTGCGSCATECSTGTLVMKAGKPVVVAGGALGCLACGHCMAVCAAGAVSVSGRGMKAGDLLPLPPVNARASADAVEGLLLARRSVRHFTDRPVDRATVDRLLDMASTAPMGFPPSEVGVVVIDGRERVQELARDVTGAFAKWLFLGTPVGSAMLRLMMDAKSAALMKGFVLPVAREIIAARQEGRDLLFYDAPCVLLFHYPLKDPIDATVACSFAAVAAESLGLGSCMIGTVAPALQGDKKLKAKWGVPEGSFPSIAMIVGHPAVRFANGVRRRFASVDRL